MRIVAGRCSPFSQLYDAAGRGNIVLSNLSPSAGSVNVRFALDSGHKADVPHPLHARKELV
jgi:hypothetical protein